MSEPMKWVFPGGQFKQEVTSVVLVNDTAKTIDLLVPAGKYWIILDIKAINGDDVARNILISKYLEAAATNLIGVLYDAARNAGAHAYFPNMDNANYPRHVASSPAELAIGGNIIRITWAAGGASTGATDADGLVIEYLEVNYP